MDPNPNPLAELISRIHEENRELRTRLRQEQAESEKQRELAEHWKGRYRETQDADTATTTEGTAS